MSLPIGFNASETMDATAQGWERAHVDVTGALLMAIDVETIADVWNPLKIRSDLLPLLAYEMAVNLYEDIWTEDQKRLWIAGNWDFLSKRGTIAGTAMALKASGYDLIQTVRPPQGFYASEDMTAAEYDSWVHLMPEVRITYQPKTGQAGLQFTADESYSDDGFSAEDDGEVLYGRYAVLRRNGVDTPIEVITRTTSTEERRSTDFERVAIPGYSEYGFHADEAAADDDLRYVDQEDVAATIVTFRLDGTYDHQVTELGVDTVTPGLEPIDATYEIDSDTGDAGPFIFSGDGIADDAFVGLDDAALMLAQRIFLLDPDVSTPMQTGSSFADNDRVGLGLRTMEAMIDLHTTAEPAASYSDQTFSDVVYAVDEDASHIERAFRAVEASRGHLDRVLVSFETYRPLAILDRVEEQTTIGEWVKNSL